MEIHVDFNILLIAIFITIFITGYIRGGGIELLRVLKVIIPFFVLYFYGDKITHLLFSSKDTVDFVYRLLPNIPYRNTIAALSSQIALYIIVYLALTIFLWRLGKYVLDERIEYWFGRYNSILGGIFSVIRMYIIVSVFIIPFYALNFTNYSDPITSFILKHPPNFSRLGIMIEKTKPTIDKMNEVSASLKIMDLQSLEKYTSLVNDVDEFLNENEIKAYDVYHYLQRNNQLSGFWPADDFMYYYVTHKDSFKEIDISDSEIEAINDELQQTVNEYEQVFIWAYNNKITDMDSKDEIMNSFIDNYANIVANTDDPLSIDVLTKIKLKTQLYLIIKDWLVNSYQINLRSNMDLLNDQNLELILNDYSLYKVDLIEAVENMEAKDFEKAEILAQIERFSQFHTEYINTFKPQIDLYNQLLEDVPFKYKLAFAIMKDKNLNKVVDEEINEDSLMYLFTLDTLDFIDYFSNAEQDVYYEAGKIYVSLFLINIDPNQQVSKVSYEMIMNNLNKFTMNEDLFIKTKIDINRVIQSLLTERNGTSYFEFLIEQGFCEANLIDQLLASDEINDILTETNIYLLRNLNNKLHEEMSETS